MNDSTASLPTDRLATTPNNSPRAISEQVREGKFPMTCPRMKTWEVIAVLLLVRVCWWQFPNLDREQIVSQFGTHYRAPKDSNEDYWRMRQLFEVSAKQEQCVVFGDSVIWGEYVDADATLTALLNRRMGELSPEFAAGFVNAGVNGMHPLALEGLIRDYADCLVDSAVILHCNLLWLTSVERDLRSDKSLSFNHPRLIHQFGLEIPAYQADYAERMSVIVERRFPFRQWVRHQWIERFGGQDLPRWSLEHPYEWPPSRPSDVKEARPSASSASRRVAWTKKGIVAQRYPWVEPEESLQWKAFQRTVGVLRERRNRVVVLIGPFNAHLLEPGSRGRWSELRGRIQAWLDEQGIDNFAPDPLPSELYADASHPLAGGYERLASQLVQQVLVKKP